MSEAVQTRLSIGRLRLDRKSPTVMPHVNTRMSKRKVSNYAMGRTHRRVEADRVESGY